MVAATLVDTDRRVDIDDHLVCGGGETQSVRGFAFGTGNDLVRRGTRDVGTVVQDDRKYEN
jgi:hypothetical protein